MDREDDRVRALLARAGGDQGPPLGFGAETIVRRGRRIRLLRWGAGVTAAVVVAAVIGLSVLLASIRQQPPASRPLPGPTPITSPTALTTTPGPTISTTTTVPELTTQYSPTR